MDSLLSFLEQYYMWFLVAGVILLFALIGFIVDSKRKKKKEEFNSTEGMQMDSTLGTPDTNNVVTDSTIVDQNNTLGMESSINANMQDVPSINNEVTADNNVGMNNTSLDSNNMNYNDIAMPEVNNNLNVGTLNQTPTNQNQEIIEGFNVGNPVSVENNVQSTNEVVNEPVINVSGPQEVNTAPNIFDQPQTVSTSTEPQMQPAIEQVNVAPVEPITNQEQPAATSENQNQEIIEIN